MLYGEFTRRTNFFPDMALFEAIHREYCEHTEWDKDEFCRAYAENRDGIAEKILHNMEDTISVELEETRKNLIRERQKVVELEKANAENKSDIDKLRQTLYEEKEKRWHLETEINHLNKKLDKELEWERLDNNFMDYIGTDYVPCIKDDEAKKLVKKYIQNIDVKDIEIIHETEIYERSRHGKLRLVKDEQADTYPWLSPECDDCSVAFRIAGADYALSIVGEDCYINNLQDIIQLVPFKTE